MKIIQMRRCDTKELVDVKYDETAPCVICGNPVINASMGGIDVCPSCDCGRWRTGEPFNLSRDMVFIIKGYEHLRPYIPTFQEVDNIASAMSARGIHVLEWELGCKMWLGDK